MKARVARLEAAIGHIQEDIRDIKAALAQLVPVVNRMDGFFQATLPALATRADIAREAVSLRHEIERRPTWARIVATLAVLAAIAAIPFWAEWVTAIKSAVSISLHKRVLEMQGEYRRERRHAGRRPLKQYRLPHLFPPLGPS